MAESIFFALRNIVSCLKWFIYMGAAVFGVWLLSIAPQIETKYFPVITGPAGHPGGQISNIAWCGGDVYAFDFIGVKKRSCPVIRHTWRLRDQSGAESFVRLDAPINPPPRMASPIPYVMRITGTFPRNLNSGDDHEIDLAHDCKGLLGLSVSKLGPWPVGPLLEARRLGPACPLMLGM